MRMTKEKLELLIALRNSKLTHAEKAKVIGCKATSISLFNRFDSWEEYEAHKKAWAEKQRTKKAAVSNEGESLREIAETNLWELVGEMAKNLEELKLATRELVGWEERKQASKEAYWAEQKQKRGYFNRWNDDK